MSNWLGVAPTGQFLTFLKFCFRSVKFHAEHWGLHVVYVALGIGTTSKQKCPYYFGITVVCMSCKVFNRAFSPILVAPFDSHLQSFLREMYSWSWFLADEQGSAAGEFSNQRTRWWLKPIPSWQWFHRYPLPAEQQILSRWCSQLPRLGYGLVPELGYVFSFIRNHWVPNCNGDVFFFFPVGNLFPRTWASCFSKVVAFSSKTSPDQ